MNSSEDFQIWHQITLKVLEPIFLEKSKQFFKTTLDNIGTKNVNFQSNIFRNGENLFSLLKDYINVLDKHNNMKTFESITTVNIQSLLIVLSKIIINN